MNLCDHFIYKFIQIMNSYDHCNSYTNSGVSRFPMGEIWTAVLSATIDRLGVV